MKEEEFIECMVNSYNDKGEIIKVVEELRDSVRQQNEFIQKIVKEWGKPNQCNKAFGKDVRQLMYEYGLITFNEETRRYEVIE